MNNHLWADSMWGVDREPLEAERKADLCADWGLMERHEHAEIPRRTGAHRALPRCTGACDQGRRDCACTTGHVIDRLPEDYDKPEPVRGTEAAKFWAVALAPAVVVLGVAGFYIWCRFGHVW